jgi:hypothetical protein
MYNKSGSSLNMLLTIILCVYYAADYMYRRFYWIRLPKKVLFYVVSIYNRIRLGI